MTTAAVGVLGFCAPPHEYCRRTTISGGKLNHPEFGAELGREGDAAVVFVSGDVDVAVAGELWEVIEAALALGGRLIIDLTDTTFMDSKGLGVFARAYRHAGRVKEAIVVRGPRPIILQALTVSGMDQLVTIDTGEGR